MAYYIDFEELTIEKFKDKLESEVMLPSQLIIRDCLDERLEILKEFGLSNLADIQKVLKTKKKVEEFSKKVDIPMEYLIVLRRLINGYHPKPRKIREFNCIEETTKDKLEQNNFKTTVDIYNRVITIVDRENLSRLIQVDANEILMLARLSDFCRLRYVNQTFSELLYESGCDSVAKIRKADANEMAARLKQTNEAKKIYGGKFGIKDMMFLISDANSIEIDIEY